MIAALVSLLVLFLVLAIIWYVVRLVAGHFQVPAVFVQVVGLILFLVWVLAAFQRLGGGRYVP